MYNTACTIQYQSFFLLWHYKKYNKIACPSGCLVGCAYVLVCFVLLSLLFQFLRHGTGLRCTGKATDLRLMVGCLLVAQVMAVVAERDPVSKTELLRHN